MSQPVVKDNYYVVLSASNNYSNTEIIQIPIVGMSRCRILCNVNVNIQADFLRDAYIINPAVSNTYFSQTGLAAAGNKYIWYPVNNKHISKATVSLYDLPAQYSTISLCFQFI